MLIDYCGFMPSGSHCYDKLKLNHKSITITEFKDSNPTKIIQPSPQFQVLELSDLKTPDLSSLGAFDVLAKVALILAGLLLLSVGKRSFKAIVAFIGAFLAAYITLLFLLPIQSFGAYRTAVLILCPLLAALIGGALLKAIYKVL
jgi:uncharacterized membrane protein